MFWDIDCNCRNSNGIIQEIIFIRIQMKSIQTISQSISENSWPVAIDSIGCSEGNKRSRSWIRVWRSINFGVSINNQVWSWRGVIGKEVLRNIQVRKGRVRNEGQIILKDGLNCSQIQSKRVRKTNNFFPSRRWWRRLLSLKRRASHDCQHHRNWVLFISFDVKNRSRGWRRGQRCPQICSSWFLRSQRLLDKMPVAFTLLDSCPEEHLQERRWIKEACLVMKKQEVKSQVSSQCFFPRDDEELISFLFRSKQNDQWSACCGVWNFLLFCVWFQAIINNLLG